MVDEGPQPSSGPTSSTPSAAYWASTRVLAIDDDPGQHAVEGQVGGHRDHRVEQQPQPGLLVEDAVDPAQHLAQQVVELDLAQPSRPPRSVIAAAVHRLLGALPETHN